jgi:hypothetical protein
MAISRIDPDPFDSASAVVIDSDASTNEQAIRDIDDWAAANGFSRTPEYWLRVISRDGKRHFRGTCYRLTEEERRSAADTVRDVQQRAGRLIPRRSA